MRRRIFGLECEYGLVIDHRERSASASLATVSRTLVPRPSATDIAPHGLWLPDGGRAYIDLGNHPETATPECLSPAAAVAHDAAALLWLEARRASFADATGMRVSLHRDNGPVHDPVRSWGVHENYLVGRPMELAGLVDTLGLHLASRVVFFGAGRSSTTSDGSLVYAPSARHHIVDRALSGSTTSVRSLVNTRDESHADHRRWRRLHVICGDSYLERSALELQLASTHLVLRVIEERPELLDDVRASDVLEVFHLAGSTTDLSATTATPEGLKLTAVDFQERFALAAAEVLAAGDVDTWELSALADWFAWIDAARAGGASSLIGRAPWATKLDLLSRLEPRLEHLDVAQRAKRRSAFEARYSELCATSGWWWRVAGFSDDEAAAAAAAAEEPPATRAVVRSELVAALEVSRLPYCSSWSSFTLGNPDRQVRMPDPFCADPSSIADDLAFVAANALYR